MKILYACPLSQNDIERIRDTGTLSGDSFLLELMAHEHSLGHEISIVTSLRGISRDISFGTNGITVEAVKLWKHGRLSALDGFRSDIKRIEHVIERHESNIYHAHWCYEYAAACLRHDLRHTVVTVHDFPDKVCPMVGNYYWKKRNKLGNEVLDLAGTMTAVSPYLGSLVRSLNDRVDIHVIPNFYDTGKISQDHKGEEKTGFIIICVNNGFSIRKNMQTGMKAFARLHEEYPDTGLKLYGYGYERGGTAYKYAKDHGINTDGMEFFGEVSHDDIETAMRKADVLLHPSIEESFGMIYLEAMAAGLPIIAGKNAGATPWILQNGGSGMLVDAESAGSVYEGLKRLYTDRDMMNELSANGKRRVMDFSSETVFEMYDGLYGSIEK